MFCGHVLLYVAMPIFDLLVRVDNQSQFLTLRIAPIKVKGAATMLGPLCNKHAEVWKQGPCRCIWSTYVKQGILAYFTSMFRKLESTTWSEEFVIIIGSH